MVITDIWTSFFPSKTSSANAISAVLFLWSDFELHNSNTCFFALHRSWGSRWENSVFRTVFVSTTAVRSVRCESFLSPKEHSNYSQSEASVSSDNSLPWQYCENKWGILPLHSVQSQFKTFSSKQSCFLIESILNKAKIQHRFLFIDEKLEHRKYIFTSVQNEPWGALIPNVFATPVHLSIPTLSQEVSSGNKESFCTSRRKVTISIWFLVRCKEQV